MINFGQFNIDFKVRPISSVDVIQAGSEFIAIGDVKG
jgi:hypothetical protein